MRSKSPTDGCCGRIGFPNLVLLWTALIFCLILVYQQPAMAQQKPQWQPGQIGLNAGILPSPGFTYANLDLNYDAGTYNNENGKAVPASGTYNVWAIENIFYFVPNTKFLGGNLGLMVMFPAPATGSLVTDCSLRCCPSSMSSVFS